MSARRLEEGRVDEEVPPQVEQVPQGAQGDQIPIVGRGNDVSVVPPEMTNGDTREALITLARTLTTYVNVPRVNVIESTMTST